MTAHSASRLAGDPQLRGNARTLEPPVGTSQAQPIPDRQPPSDPKALIHARAVARVAFGPPSQRHFAIAYWGEAYEPAGVGTAQFTLRFRSAASMRAAFWPPSESRVGEAVMRGDVEVEGNLEAAAAVAPAIRDRLCRPRALARLGYHATRLPRETAARDAAHASRLDGRARHTRRHSLARDSAAIKSHYDVGNDFYALWLDRRMVYSCAYFASPDSSLDDAQRDKLDHLCRKLRLKPGETLLDVGCGWGALVCHAVRHYGVRATGITLSEQQAAWGRQRIRNEGMEDRAGIQVLDYRALRPGHPFDKIVSVGMFEHLGPTQMETYFHTMFGLLRPGGLFMNHGIVEAPTRHARGWRSALRRLAWHEGSFIDRHVFPDGQLVPLALEIGTAESAGFETRDVESLRPHYVRTLRAWVDRLEQRWPDAVRLTDEVTARTWRLYMAASAHAFDSGQIGLAQVLFARPDARGRVALPPTRGDLYR